MSSWFERERVERRDNWLSNFGFEICPECLAVIFETDDDEHAAWHRRLNGQVES